MLKFLAISLCGRWRPAAIYRLTPIYFARLYPNFSNKINVSYIAPKRCRALSVKAMKLFLSPENDVLFLENSEGGSGSAFDI